MHLEQMKSTKVAGYLVRNARDKVLTTAGMFCRDVLCGPGNYYSAKVYKTERLAQKFNPDCTVHAVNAHGIEISKLETARLV